MHLKGGWAVGFIETYPNFNIAQILFAYALSVTR